MRLDVMHEIETPRLIGQRICSSHLEFMINMQSDPLVMETLGGVRDRATTIQNLQWNMEQWDSHGHGLWIFHYKDTSEIVGRGGLRKVHIEESEEVEVGYALLPPFWGKGLATEIARVSILVAFTHFDYNDVVSFTLTTNSASEKVMRKTGFKYETDFVRAGLSHVLYRIRRDDWNDK